jgi:hypothetical protein
MAPVRVRVVAAEPIEVVELIGPEGVMDQAWGGGRRVDVNLGVGTVRSAGEWRYVRVVQADGEVAWDSPWWIGGSP